MQRGKIGKKKLMPWGKNCGVYQGEKITGRGSWGKNHSEHFPRHLKEGVQEYNSAQVWYYSSTPVAWV